MHLSLSLMLCFYVYILFLGGRLKLELMKRIDDLIPTVELLAAEAGVDSLCFLVFFFMGPF